MPRSSAAKSLVGSPFPGSLEITSMDLPGPQSQFLLAVNTLWAHVGRQPSSNVQCASDESQPPLQLLMIGAYGHRGTQPRHNSVLKVTCLPGHMVT